MKKKIIIDTDPAMGTKGGDPEDCFAIMLAMNSPELEILGHLNHILCSSFLRTL